MISLQEWLGMLRGLHGLAGIPLVVAGAGLMLFGWRLWKLCVMLSFGVLFTWLGARLIGPSDDQWSFALAAGAGLGLLSYWSVRQAVSVLGGLIGGGMITYLVGVAGVTGNGLWASGGIAFIGCTAYSFLNRQRVVIAITAFFGAVLLISGLATWLTALPSLYGSLYTLATGSVLLVPFFLLVPTVMSCFYQMAEVHRLGVEL